MFAFISMTIKPCFDGLNTPITVIAEKSFIFKNYYINPTFLLKFKDGES